jgi:1,2-diacylglycerol 3-alpha-glucosyltransferase
MRILITSPTFPPHNSGIGNAVFTQATSLVKAGIDVEVATGGPRSSEIFAGIKVERFAVTGADFCFHPIRGQVNEYIDYLKKEDRDIILLNGWQNWATDTVLRHIDQIPGRKILYSHCISTNSFFYNQPIRSCLRYLGWRPYWWRLRNYINSLDGIIFLAPDGAPPRFDDLSVAKALKVPLWVIPNSLSQFSLASLDIKPLPSESSSTLISIGSYQWQKGFDYVIRAFAASGAFGRFTLHLYGQEFTNYCSVLRALVCKLGLPRDSVVMHENISGEKLLSAYRNAQLVLLGSHSECQPLSLIDANACGTPFVARSTGCIENMPGGLAVVSWQEMAEQIKMLLSNPSTWQKLSYEGRQAASHLYHPDHNSRLLLNIFNELNDKDRC